MTECSNEIVSVAEIYSAAKKRNMPHIVRWDNKLLRVKEVGLRQYLKDGELILAHDVIADSGLQLTLLFNTESSSWSLEQSSQSSND